MVVRVGREGHFIRILAGNAVGYTWVPLWGCMASCVIRSVKTVSEKGSRSVFFFAAITGGGSGLAQRCAQLPIEKIRINMQDYYIKNFTYFCE